MQEKGRLISTQTIGESANLTLLRIQISSFFETRLFRLSMRYLQAVRESFQQIGYTIKLRCYLSLFEAISLADFRLSFVVTLTRLKWFHSMNASIAFLSRDAGRKPSKRQS